MMVFVCYVNFYAFVVKITYYFFTAKIQVRTIGISMKGISKPLAFVMKTAEEFIQTQFSSSDFHYLCTINTLKL